ncbi:hypothetical protein BCR35DRAFT_308154 [Leucosporidium creatinivorum]|uniref:CsbD-like domain-containing protein n=1 Tax=Leucosporidium creatinivorum TaxID=106004 RepID=A0A1Y2EC32_9BASI|nr:hypothetical protein BCR35DRAFT_308154 [Leucosporidium creatinivorum]
MAFQSNNAGSNATGQQTTGYGQGPTDRLANEIPGHHTGAPGQLPGSHNPTGHSADPGYTTTVTGNNPNSGLGGGNSTFGGASATQHGSNTHASNTFGSKTGSSNNYDSNNPVTSATHGTHEGGFNQGPTDKLANALPGHHTGAPGALPGSNNPSAKDQQHSSSHTGTGVGATHGTHNTHNTHGSSGYDSNNPVTSATHGTHEHGLNQGPADRAANAAPGHHTGAPGSVPGSHNPSAHQAGLGSTTGSHTTTGAGSHHDNTRTRELHDSASSTHTKPSVADKIGGKVDVLIGKATHNEEKIVQGEIKQTEGKAGLEHNAGTTGAGRY